MENTEQKIPLWGPAGLYEARPDEVETLLGGGYQPATEEQVKFSTTPEAIKGYGEAVGRGLGGAFFTAAERALGVDPQSIENRRQISVGENAALATELATMAVPIGVIGKVAKAAELGQAVSPLLSAAEKVSKFTFPGAIDVAGNLASRGIEGAAAKLAMKYGVENALFSVSDDFGKKLVSDKPEDVNEVLSGVLAHAALSGIVGAGIGAGVGKVGELWKAKKGAKVANAIDQIKADTNPELPLKPPTEPVAAVEPALAAEEVVKPTPTIEPMPVPKTYEEYLAQAEKLKKLELPEVELPDIKTLQGAQERLGSKLKVPADNLQLKALESLESKKELEILKSQTPELSEFLEKKAQLQRFEAEQGIQSSLETMSKNIVDDELLAGKKHLKNLVEEVTKNVEKESQDWTKFKKISLNPISSQVDIVQKFEQVDPAFRNYLDIAKDGKIKLKPYSALDVKVTEATYKKLQKIVGIFNRKDLTIENIWNAKKAIAPAFKTEEKATIRELKEFEKSLMQVMVDAVKKVDPSFETAQMFQDYAIRQSNIDELERTLHGSLSKYGEQINPENVVKYLMKDINTINFVKGILPEEKFNEFLADAIAVNMEKVKKEGVREGFYSSRKFGSWLKKNEQKLIEAFGNKSGILQDIKDWNTFATIVPDMPRAYTGSADIVPKTFGKQVQDLQSKLNSISTAINTGSITGIAMSAAKKVTETLLKKSEEFATKKQVEQAITEMITGTEKQAGAASILRTIKDWSKNTNAAAFEAMRQYFSYAAKGTYLINKEVKNVFDEETKPTIKPMSKKELDKLDRKVQSLANNPEELLNVGGNVGYYAPEHATAMGMVSARAVQYLASKKPAPKKNGPLDREIPPSTAQVNDYYRTLETAENPVKILQRIKDGTLHSRDIVDFKNLYPELYNIFVQKLTNELVNAQTKGKPIPYQIRKGLSLFSGMPMDSNMQPQSIQAAQATYQPQQQPQAQLPQMAKKSSRVSKLPSLTETDQQRRMLNK